VDNLTLTSERLAEVRALLEELRERGASVEFIPPETIEVRGEGAAPLIPRIRDLKPAVVTYLANPPTWPCVRCKRYAFAEAGVLCYWCRTIRGGAA